MDTSRPPVHSDAQARQPQRAYGTRFLAREAENSDDFAVFRT